MNKLMSKLMNNLKKLYTTGALHITIGTFATKFVAIFGSIFVVRILDKSDYGLLGYIETIYGYAYLLIGFGLFNSLLRYLIIAKEERKETYFDYILKHSFFRDILIVLIIVFVNYWVTYPTNFSKTKFWLPILAIVLPFEDLATESLYALRALFKNKVYAYFSFALSTTLIIGKLIGGYFFQINGVVISRIIVNCALAIIFFLYAKNQFVHKNELPLTFNEKKEVNIYALQYMLTNGLWTIFMLNDTLLLGRLVNNPNVLADYKVAYVFPGNLSIFANAIGTYVGPYFTKHENEKEWVKRNYIKVFLVNVGIIGFVSIVLFVFAKPIILFVYGEEYANTYRLMRLLLVAACINSGIRSVSAHLLASMGEIKYNMIVSLLGMVLSFVLDILLIGKYQAYGVAYSSCIAYAFMAIALNIIFYKKYYRKE